MTLPKEELYSLCLMADGYSDEQLELAIKDSITPRGRCRFSVPNLQEHLEVCRKYLDEFSEEIYLLAKNNPKTVDLVFEICQYILPTIVQDERSISEGVVVFIITLFCRKGIMNYILKM